MLIIDEFKIILTTTYHWAARNHVAGGEETQLLSIIHYLVNCSLPVICLVQNILQHVRQLYKYICEFIMSTKRTRDGTIISVRRLGLFRPFERHCNVKVKRVNLTYVDFL